MKKTLTAVLAMLLILASVFTLSACFDTVDAEGLWENATYRRDKSFGNGEKTVKVEVKVGEDSVTFTVKSDEKYLGDALAEHGLIEGEEGQFGLYIKKVNGMLADYDVDRSWWGFYKNGEYQMLGIDLTEFADGEHYELVYES